MDAVTRCPNCGEPLEGEKLRICPKCASSLPKDLLVKTKEAGGLIQELTDFPKSSGLTAQDGQALQERAAAYKETYAKEIAAGDFEDFEWIETTAIKELTQLLEEFPAVIKKREAEIAESKERERKEAEEKAERERKEAEEKAERERKEIEEKAERKKREAKVMVTIPAPVAGTVLRHAVAEGANVKSGDTVLIIEAMKMELEIKATSAGPIHFLVPTGTQVVSQQPVAEIAGGAVGSAVAGGGTTIPAPAAGKDRVIAYVLLIFLGYFGAHQFYLGNKKAGILRLALVGAGVVGGALAMVGGAVIAGIAALWITVLWFKDLFTLWRHVE